MAASLILVLSCDRLGNSEETLSLGAKRVGSEPPESTSKVINLLTGYVLFSE